MYQTRSFGNGLERCFMNKKRKSINKQSVNKNYTRFTGKVRAIRRKRYKKSRNEFANLLRIVKHMPFTDIVAFYNYLNNNRRDDNIEWQKLAAFIAGYITV